MAGSGSSTSEFTFTVTDALLVSLVASSKDPAYASFTSEGVNVTLSVSLSPGAIVAGNPDTDTSAEEEVNETSRSPPPRLLMI